MKIRKRSFCLLLASILCASYAMGQSPARILIKFRSGTQALAEARAGVSRSLMEARTLAEPPLAGTRVAMMLSAAGVVQIESRKAGRRPATAPCRDRTSVHCRCEP